MKEATELNEDMLEEAEHLALLEPEDDGKEVNHITTPLVPLGRSEERRVGKECRL